MTIRNRLTYKFTIIVVSILLLFSAAIYYFSSNDRENVFYLRLRSKALTTARLLISTKGIDHDLLKAIDKNTVNSLSQGKVMIFNDQNQEIYNSIEHEREKNIDATIELLNNIRSKGEVFFKNGDKDVVGIIFKYKYENFVVIASALDEFGLRGLSDLRLILIIGLIITICIIRKVTFQILRMPCILEKSSKQE